MITSAKNKTKMGLSMKKCECAVLCCSVSARRLGGLRGRAEMCRRRVVVPVSMAPPSRRAELQQALDDDAIAGAQTGTTSQSLPIVRLVCSGRASTFPSAATTIAMACPSGRVTACCTRMAPRARLPPALP
jgi:hypothetical protein